MKQNLLHTHLLPAIIVFVLAACGKSSSNNSGLSQNPSAEELNKVAASAELGMRTGLDTYFDAVGIIGREIYRFSPTEQRYTTDLLGSGSTTLANNQFYFTQPWSARYNVIKQAVQLIKGAEKSTKITDAQLRGYIGFGKTIIAHQLLMNLGLTYTNGIYFDRNSNNPASGPVIPYVAALDTIARLLNEAKTALTGSALPPLSAGFTSYKEFAGFIKFNRALAARVAIYRQQWSAALVALNESFFDLNGSMDLGPQHIYVVFQGDILNPSYIPKNQAANVRLAHPSYAINIAGSDDRIGKTALRTETSNQDGLSSKRDAWTITSQAAPIHIIRNEELILIYAEAKIQLNAFPDGIVALNRIRVHHNLTPYGGAVTQAALINEVLNQRRYSLFNEGHRWIDLRRYSKLNTLPVDRPGDDVWTAFPLP